MNNQQLPFEEIGYHIDEPEQIERDSAFNPDNVLPVLLIQVSRLYDVMMTMLGTIDEAKMEKLYKYHHDGEFIMSNPSFKESSE